MLQDRPHGDDRVKKGVGTNSASCVDVILYFSFSRYPLAQMFALVSQWSLMATLWSVGYDCGPCSSYSTKPTSTSMIQLRTIR